MQNAVKREAKVVHSFRTLLVLGGLALWSISAPSAWAQAYPTRPLTLIVPFAAGGAADTTGRIMADAMARHLGRPIIVENVGGAGGAIGSLRGKNARPDGYT